MSMAVKNGDSFTAAENTKQEESVSASILEADDKKKAANKAEDYDDEI